MKRLALIGALVISLATGATAFAGDHGHDRHHKHERAHYTQRYDVRGDRHARVVRRAPVRYGVYQRPRGYYTHRWIRGERLPVGYYSRPYVIVDYGPFGLRAPPRGYHWVRVERDAVLAAVATGIVLDTVFHVFN